MINLRIFFALCLGALLATATAPAWAVSLNDVIRTLETPFQGTTDQTKIEEKTRIYDYSADFFQESKITSLNRLQRANGRVEVAFDYRRDQTVPTAKFRWQYDQPTTSVGNMTSPPPRRLFPTAKPCGSIYRRTIRSSSQISKWLIRLARTIR